MGVKGLWQLLEPAGRPVTLESLEGKVLSVDASILLNQAVKGMRDKSGQPVPNAHLVVLFNRLCKLLFYRVKPVFVFDGGVPVLKKKTLAARKERKLKARYGSNKAAEKLIKSYLKGKALESVTGRKSENRIFQNNSPRETDIFEISSLPENKSERSEEESEVSLLEEFYAQNDFENKFQDPSRINVDSEDFRCLPEEIQHELIKDKMEEKKFTGMNAMPQDGFDFSTFQLQSVLQRGKLHQRLDELRKNMNSRNTGEISGLSSQDSFGSEFNVQSRRIVSEDSGHYILVKTTKADNDDTESSTIDSNEGGFFHDHHTMQAVKPPVAPSFMDIDLTGENDSDSEITSPLMDVPEIDMSSCLPIHEAKVSYATEKDMTSEKEKTDSSQNGSEGQSIDKKAIDNQGKSELHDYSAGLKTGNNDTIDVIELNDSSERLNTVNNGSHTKEELSIVYERFNTPEKSTCGEGSKGLSKTMNTANIVDIGTVSEKKTASNESLIEEHYEEANDMSSIEVHIAHQDDIHASISPSNAALINETETNDAEIQKRKAKIESLLNLRQRQTTSPSHDVQLTERSTTDEGEEAQMDTENSTEFVLQLESSDGNETDMEITKELSVLQTENIEKDGILSDDQEDVTEVQSQNEEKESLDTSNVQRESFLAEFAGTSKEDLQVMQVNLEMEQNSLQSEQARQARAAASVSNEMLTESQELLRLFGVPYLVSPMEAEAQCAFLDLTDQTHGTITDDSDVFLFGGQRVYKHLFTHNKHPELYTIEAISGGFALNRSQLIKLALITGSDYTEGIQGLGAVSAIEVLHEFNHEGFEALLKFKKWHEETKHNKQKTQETKVKKKLRTITLPTGFPSREVFDSYINPVIDETRGSFEWGKPDLHSLRLFAKERLGWTNSKTDEVLLPVLKQLNQNHTQKRIDSFFPIKFQELRKKPSKRVRRVVNRFLNPDPLSESSSDEENTNKTKTESPPTKPNSKGKSTTSRKKGGASRNSRGRARGRMEVNTVSRDTEHGMFDQNLLIDSDGEFERLIAGETLNESINNKNDKNDEKSHKNTTERNKSEGSSMRNKRKLQLEADWDLDQVIPPEHENIEQCNNTVNLDNKIHCDGPCKGKTSKNANLSTKQTGVSAHQSFSDDSSTPSDTDSEDERKLRMSSTNINQKVKKDYRTIGAKGKRGRGGRGRGKRLKTFN